MRFDALGGPAPRVALLTRGWGAADETGWALRQVAGALALCADVHVVTPGGVSPGERADGVFTLHELASDTRSAKARRDLALAALLESSRAPSAPPAMIAGPRSDAPRAADDSSDAPLARPWNDSSVRRTYRLLCEHFGDPWQPAVGALRGIGPDLVLICGYQELGALRALEGGCPDVPMLLVPLRPGSPPGRPLARAEEILFSPVFDRARCVLVFTDAERRSLEMSRTAPATRPVGVPMSVNRSVENEANAYVGGTDYVLVLSARPLEDEMTMPWTELLRLSSPARRVAFCASDASVVYEGAQVLYTLPPLRRETDLLRLMAWATATVDLHPGPLFARRSLQSLMTGTAVVVPQDSVAREHAETGNGGLWFDGPGTLTWSAEAICDPDVSATLGRQGKRYAHDRYGSTASFVANVMSAANLEENSDESYTSAGG